MTNNDKDLIDLHFLLAQQEPIDMSPEAVTKPMEAMGELCDLALKLQIPDIYPYRPRYEASRASN